MESYFKIVSDVEELAKVGLYYRGGRIPHSLDPDCPKEGVPFQFRGLLADLGRLTVAFLVVLAAVYTLMSIGFACNLTIPPM